MTTTIYILCAVLLLHGLIILASHLSSRHPLPSPPHRGSLLNLLLVNKQITTNERTEISRADVKSVNDSKNGC